MNINRLELLTAVKAAQRFTGRKMPVTQNVLLKAEDGVLSVIGTDLDAALRADIVTKNVPLESVAVSAAEFSQILSVIKDEDIALSVTGNRLVVKRSSGDVKMATVSANAFPNPVFASDGATFTFDAKDLRDALKLSGFALGEEEFGATAFHGVAEIDIFTNLIESKFTIKATDEKVLSCVSGLCEKGEGLDDSKLYIPKSAIGRMLSILPVSGSVKVSQTQNSVFFEFDNLSCSFRKSAIKFPDIAVVLDAESPIRITANSADLLTAIKGASIFTPANAQDVFWEVGDEIIVTAGCADKGEFTETIECDSDEEFTRFETGFKVSYITDILSRIDGEVNLMFRESQDAHALRVETEQTNVKAILFVQGLKKTVSNIQRMAA